MKKVLFIVLSILLMIPSAVFAIDEITAEDNGYHPYKEVVDYAEPNTFWSIYLDAGFSHFDGDRTAKLLGPTAKHSYSPDFGLGVEYSFTPCWGVWVDYHATTYGQYMFDKDVEYGVGSDARSFGQMNAIRTGLSYNLLNGFFPRRQVTWMNLYAQVGGGLGVYLYHGAGNVFKQHADGTFEMLSSIISDAYTNGNGSWTANSDDVKKYNAVGLIHFGLLLQFNITRSFELGLRGYYDMYTNDYVDGNTNMLNPNNKRNDGMFGLDLQARWAFGAKKDSHTRNYANVERFDRGIEARKAAARQDSLENALDSLKNALDSIQNLPLLANNGHDTIINNYAGEKSNAPWEDIYFVYFPNDVYELDDEGHIRVQEMAERLNMWPEACLQLTGYADATSNAEHNEWLSWNRSQTVRNELINLYGISADRLIDMGRGQLDNVSGSFRANRRVTMKLVPQAQMDSLRQVRDEANENFRKNNPEANGDRKQSARSQALNEETARSTNTPYRATPYGVEEKKVELKEDTTVVVKPGENLGVLAYKYYKKASCWVYIYEANKDVLVSPASLKNGMELKIPALTEEQKAQAGQLLQKFKL